MLKVDDFHSGLLRYCKVHDPEKGKNKIIDLVKYSNSLMFGGYIIKGPNTLYWHDYDCSHQLGIIIACSDNRKELIDCEKSA